MIANRHLFLPFCAALLSVSCSNDETATSKTLEQSRARLLQDTSANMAAHPNLLPSQALAQTARSMAESRLAQSTPAQEKLTEAASQFAGYYYVNVKTRYEYCASLEVDITPFVNAFKLAHSDEYRIASTELAKTNNTIESLGSQSAVFYNSQIGQSMADTARVNNLSNSTEMCNAFAQHATNFADAYSAKKIMPKMYAVLHSR